MRYAPLPRGTRRTATRLSIGVTCDQWPAELRSVRAYDAVQRPGDVLYLPQYTCTILSPDRNFHVTACEDAI